MLVCGTTSGSKGGRVREGKPEVKEGFPGSREAPQKDQWTVNPLTADPSRGKNHLGGVNALFHTCDCAGEGRPGVRAMVDGRKHLATEGIAAKDERRE